MRRFMRLITRLLLASAVLGGVVQIRRALLGRPSDSPGSTGGPGDGGIRTGSFDHWPAVPVAPGRDRSGV